MFTRQEPSPASSETDLRGCRMRTKFWVEITLFLFFVHWLSFAATLNIIYSFPCGADGEFPGELTFDELGNLYGTAYGGNEEACAPVSCGIVFELKHTSNGWKAHVIYPFQGGADGGVPSGGVIFDKAGNLFGTTARGGDNDHGTVFRLSPDPQGGWKESIIYRFHGASMAPRYKLVFDSKGNLFGVLSAAFPSFSYCYPANPGGVFELTPQADGTWTETTIHIFKGAPDGSVPSESVMIDQDGNVYGTTACGGTGNCAFSGGLPGCGTAFKLT